MNKKTTIITSLSLAIVTSLLYVGYRRAKKLPMPPMPPGATAEPSGVAIAPTPQEPALLEIIWQMEAGTKDQLQWRIADGATRLAVLPAWQSVPGATSSPVIVTATQPAKVFRLVRTMN